MGKWWSALFAVVMLACLGMFMVAPFVPTWWLPEGVSTHSGQVDALFYIILYVTGFFFVLTEALLVYFMFKYAGQPGTTPRPEQPVAESGFFAMLHRWFPDAHRVEVAWTIVPALILLFIAFAQVPTWLEIKDRSRKPGIGGEKTPIQCQVSARQFEWRVRYPSSQRLRKWQTFTTDEKTIEDFKSFGSFDGAEPRHKHLDDVRLVNEVHTWKGQTVLVQLNTIDVLHSFNIPHMRVKQDALPGRTIPVWFTPTKANTRFNEETKRWEDGYNFTTKQPDKRYRWEIACAELCGWGHHRMIGRVYVHETKDDFYRWLEYAEQSQSPPTKEQEKVAAR